MTTRLEQFLQDLHSGGNTTVFTIVHSVLSKPAQGAHARNLATVSWVADNGEIETQSERGLTPRGRSGV